MRIRTLAKKLKDANDAVAAATLQKDTLEGRCTTPGTAEDVVELEVEAPVDAPEAVPEEEEEEAPLALEAVASPAAVPAPPQTQTPPIVVNIVIEPVERAHVMLCLIHDDAPATRIESESPLAPPPPPAALIAEDEKEDETPPSRRRRGDETETTAADRHRRDPAAESPRVRNRPPPPPAGDAEIARWPEKQKPTEPKKRDSGPRSGVSNSNADAARRSRSGGGKARPPLAAAGGRTSKA